MNKYALIGYSTSVPIVRKNANGFNISLFFDDSEFAQFLSDLDVQVKSVAQSTRIKKDIAQMIINFSRNLVPYKDTYRMRRYLYRVDKTTGKRKLIDKEYYKSKYSVGKRFDTGTRGRIYWKETTDPLPSYADAREQQRLKSLGSDATPTRFYYVVPKDDNYMARIYPKTNLSKKEQKEYKKYEQELVPKKLFGVTHVDASGKGVVKRKPVVKWNYQEGFNSTSQTIKHKNVTQGIATGYKAGTVYADRPPHLKNSYKIVKTASGNVGIKYVVRKTPDKHFIDDGGIDYAYQQYMADDAKWNRTTANTTSRWLEVGIGADVSGSDIAVPKINKGDANFEAIKNFVINQIRRGK